jgi:hypothetical protein
VEEDGAVTCGSVAKTGAGNFYAGQVIVNKGGANTFASFGDGTLGVTISSPNATVYNVISAKSGNLAGAQALIISGTIDAAQDAAVAGTGVVEFRASQNTTAAAAVVNRALFWWKNNTTQVMGMDPSGNLTLGGTLGTGANILYAGNVELISARTTTNSFSVTASSLTSGNALYVYSNSSDATSRNLIYGINDNTAATGTILLNLRNDADSYMAFFNCPGNTTTEAILIQADNLTSATAFRVYSNSSSSSARYLTQIVNDNTAATGVTPLYIHQDALTSTNFQLIANFGGSKLWRSNGNTPNGALSGTAGDICIGADSGKAYYCSSGTTWVAM